LKDEQETLRTEYQGIESFDMLCMAFDSGKSPGADDR